MPPHDPLAILFQIVLAVWVFVVGGAVGSFLNVVVYRLPRGMSLTQPGSHCPACKRPIRWRDNIPILGWFLLGGRCRDCKAKIAFRYPLVEAITAATCLAVWLVEGFSPGTSLPQSPILSSDGDGFPTVFYSHLFLRVSYYLVLLCGLLAAGLIQYDGHRVPLRLVWPALVIGTLLPLTWAEVGPAPAFVGWREWVAALAVGAAGLAVGALVGLAASYALGAMPTRSVGMSRRSRDRHGDASDAMPPDRDRLGLVLALACVGLFLGWQAAVVLGLASMALHLAATALGRKWPAVQRLSPNLFLAAAALGWILTWPDLVRPAFFWPIL